MPWTYISHSSEVCIQCCWSIFTALCFQLLLFFCSIRYQKKASCSYSHIQNLNEWVSKQLYSISAITRGYCHRYSCYECCFGFQHSRQLGCFSWHHYCVCTPFHMICTEWAWFSFIRNRASFSRNRIQQRRHFVGFSVIVILSQTYWISCRASQDK